MSVLKDHYAQYTSEYLLERRALGADLSEEAHKAIESIFAERGENLPPRSEKPWLVSSDQSTLPKRGRALRGRLTTFLFGPGPALWPYCVIAWPVALIPSILFLSIAMLVLRIVGLEPRMPVHPPMTPLWIFVTVIAGPLAETALLAVGLWTLKRVLRTPVQLAAVSAVLWGLLHAMHAPIWFFGTAWSFFVFSAAYIAWRQRTRTHAFIAAAVPHGLVNLTAIAMTRVGA